MNEREIAERGELFKSRVRRQFEFLVEEFGFDAAVDESRDYAHQLSFTNHPLDRLVVVVNAYHGNDYGFEVDVYRASGPRPIEGRTMIYYKLKEDQDLGLAFVDEAACALRLWFQAGHEIRQ